MTKHLVFTLLAALTIVASLIADQRETSLRIAQLEQTQQEIVLAQALFDLETQFQKYGQEMASTALIVDGDEASLLGAKESEDLLFSEIRDSLMRAQKIASKPSMKKLTTELEATTQSYRQEVNECFEAISAAGGFALAIHDCTETPRAAAKFSNALTVLRTSTEQNISSHIHDQIGRQEQAVATRSLRALAFCLMVGCLYLVAQKSRESLLQSQPSKN